MKHMKEEKSFFWFDICPAIFLVATLCTIIGVVIGYNIGKPSKSEPVVVLPTYTWVTNGNVGYAYQTLDGCQYWVNSEFSLVHKGNCTNHVVAPQLGGANSYLPNSPYNSPYTIEIPQYQMEPYILQHPFYHTNYLLTNGFFVNTNYLRIYGSTNMLFYTNAL